MKFCNAQISRNSIELTMLSYIDQTEALWNCYSMTMITYKFWFYLEMQSSIESMSNHHHHGWAYFFGLLNMQDVRCLC